MSVSLNATNVRREKNDYVVYNRTLVHLTCTWKLLIGPPQPPLNRDKREIPPEDAQALVRVVCYCVSMLLR